MKLTVLTDSMELYQSRLREMQEQNGKYTELQEEIMDQRYSPEH